MVNIIEHMFGL